MQPFMAGVASGKFRYGAYIVSSAGRVKAVAVTAAAELQNPFLTRTLDYNFRLTLSRASLPPRLALSSPMWGTAPHVAVRVHSPSTSISAACVSLVSTSGAGPLRVANSLNVRFQIAPASSWP